MNLTFTVKIKGGPRTPAEVEVTARGQLKVLTLINGKHITNVAIAEWIDENLTGAFRRLEAEGENTNRSNGDSG